MTISAKQWTKKAILVVLVVTAAFNAGCRNSGYRDPISKFQSAATVVIASTRLYVTELNKVERDHYITSKLSRREQIKLNELEAMQVFNPEGLKARLDAMDQLAGYGNLLSKLANSDAPEKVTAEAQTLGEAIKKLSGEVSGLTGSDDAAFKSAVGPVATIVGNILSMIIEKKIRDALNKAIKEGEVPINHLLGVIRSDITLAYERKRSALSDMRVVLVDEYERERSKGQNADVEKLRIFAERIRDHEDRWEAFASANPGEGLDAMAKAHSALVKYAQSGQKVTDLATLVDAMEAFAARAASIGRALQSLHAISR